MGSSPVTHGDALRVAVSEKKILLLVSLRRSDYDGAPSDSGCVDARLLENPRCHHRRAMESEVPSAEVPIGSDHHVGVLLRCGIESEFLLRGKLCGFEYHDCFCCKM